MTRGSQLVVLVVGAGQPSGRPAHRHLVLAYPAKLLDARSVKYTTTSADFALIT
jgi:hypothetical protein